MQRHSENAEKIAMFLKEHNEKLVMYIGQDLKIIKIMILQKIR